jgi:ribosomal protein L40E
MGDKVKCRKCGAKVSASAKFCEVCGADMALESKKAGKSAEIEKVTNKIEHKIGFWAHIIPGYHGYKHAQTRREADKFLRDYLVKMLKSTKKDLTSLQEELLEIDKKLVAKIEDMIVSLDTFINKINHADYGYALGTFEIGPKKLEKLEDFDKTVAESVMDLDDTVKKFVKAPGSDPAVKVKEIHDKIKKEIEIYNQRDEYMNGLSVNV